MVGEPSDLEARNQNTWPRDYTHQLCSKKSRPGYTGHFKLANQMLTYLDFIIFDF